MKEKIPLWFVAFEYPINITCLTIGLRRDIISNNSRIEYAINIDMYQDKKSFEEIEKDINNAIIISQSKCDMLNERIKRANNILEKEKIPHRGF
jgi:hypothetical protein